MRNKKARIPDPNSFVTCPGERFQVQYQATVQKDGTIKLTPCGKVDIVEFINSFRETCDMAYIVRELQRGNYGVLDQRSAFYGDFTSAPKSMMEFQQRVLDGQHAFYQLPLEVRNKYDNNMWLWMNDAGSQKWMDCMKDFMPQKDVPVDPIASEVKTDA